MANTTTAKKNTKTTKTVNDDGEVEVQQKETTTVKQDGGAKKKAGKASSKTVKKTAKKAPANKGAKKAAPKAKKAGSERYFKLMNKDGTTYGRYVGDTPKQAASKGYTKFLQKLKVDKKKIPGETIIYLRESTRGSNRKVYGYSASRVKLDEPQELNILDKVTGETKKIVYNYRNRIKKVAVPEQLGGLAKKKSSKAAKPASKSKKAAPKAAKKGPNGKAAGKKASTGSKTAKKAPAKAKKAAK